MTDENEFVVERIEDRKTVNGSVFYLVKWDSWPASHNTWEPESNLKNIRFMIDEFNRKNDETEVNEQNLKSLKERQLNDPTFGNLKFGDVPDKIIQYEVTQSKDKDIEINCVVAWQPRKNGDIPKNSIVSNAMLRSRCPRVLVEYYESKIRPVTKKEKIHNPEHHPVRTT